MRSVALLFQATRSLLALIGVGLTAKPEKPKVPPGFFQSFKTKNSTTRNVVLYWQNLSEVQWNGPTNHRYVVNLDDDYREINKTSVEYENVMSEKQLKFNIVANNEEGLSNPTPVVVPKTSQLLPAPKARKEYLGNGVFRITWAPLDRNDIINYTIVWCKDPSTNAIDCDGSFDWKNVDGSSLSDNISIEGMTSDNVDIAAIPFAVAANSVSSSSGLVWIDKDVAGAAYTDLVPIIAGIVVAALVLLILMAICLKRKELGNLWKPPNPQFSAAVMNKSYEGKSNYQIRKDNEGPTKEVYWNSMLNGSVFATRGSSPATTKIDQFQGVQFHLLRDEPSLHDTDSSAVGSSMEANSPKKPSKQDGDDKRNPSGNSNGSKAADYVVASVNDGHQYMVMDQRNAFDNKEYVVVTPRAANVYQNVSDAPTVDLSPSDDGYIPPGKLNYITPEVNYISSEDVGPVTPLDVSPSGYVTEEQADSLKPGKDRLAAAVQPSGYVTEEQVHPMSPYCKLTMDPENPSLDILDQPVALPSSSPSNYMNQQGYVTQTEAALLKPGEEPTSLSQQNVEHSIGIGGCSQDNDDSLGYVTQEQAGALTPPCVPANTLRDVPNSGSASGSDYVTQDQAFGFS